MQLRAVAEIQNGKINEYKLVLQKQSMKTTDVSGQVSFQDGLRVIDSEFTIDDGFHDQQSFLSIILEPYLIMKSQETALYDKKTSTMSQDGLVIEFTEQFVVSVFEIIAYAGGIQFAIFLLFRCINDQVARNEFNAQYKDFNEEFNLNNVQQFIRETKIRNDKCKQIEIRKRYKKNG